MWWFCFDILFVSTTKFWPNFWGALIAKLLEFYQKTPLKKRNHFHFYKDVIEDKTTIKLKLEVLKLMDLKSMEKEQKSQSKTSI